MKNSWPITLSLLMATSCLQAPEALQDMSAPAPDMTPDVVTDETPDLLMDATPDQDAGCLKECTIYDRIIQDDPMVCGEPIQCANVPPNILAGGLPITSRLEVGLEEPLAISFEGSAMWCRMGQPSFKALPEGYAEVSNTDLGWSILPLNPNLNVPVRLVMSCDNEPDKLSPGVDLTITLPDSPDLWLRAGSIEAVGRWPLEGKNDAAQLVGAVGSEPILETSGGYPLLKINENDPLVGPANWHGYSLPETLDFGDEYVVFVAVRQQNMTIRQNVLFSSGTGTAHEVRLRDLMANDPRFEYENARGEITSFVIPNTSETQVYGLRVESNTIRLFFEDEIKSPVASGAMSDNPGPLRVRHIGVRDPGDATSFPWYFRGAMGEAIIFKSALTDAQMWQIARYLERKYIP